MNTTPWKNLVKRSRTDIRLSKAGLKKNFNAEIFLAETLAQNIRNNIDREIMNDLLSVV